jgi:hypothetical protein
VTKIGWPRTAGAVSFYFQRSDWERLEVLCRLNGMNRSEVVRKLIYQAHKAATR